MNKQWLNRRFGASIRGCGGTDGTDLAGGALQFLIAQGRCHVVFLRQRKKSSVPKRFLKECHGGIERTLPP